MITFNRAVALVLGIAIFGACGGETPEAKSPSVAAPETPSARADANKALVKRFLDESWGKKDPEAIPKYVAADLVNHAAIPQAQGASGLQTIVRKLLKAFPDMTMSITSMAADEDLVIVRAAFEGTHRATLEFARPLEATNKHMKIDQVHTYRVKDGRIVETWMVMDRLDLLTQLGMDPGAERKPSPP